MNDETIRTIGQMFVESTTTEQLSESEKEVRIQRFIVRVKQKIEEKRKARMDWAENG